MIPDIIAEEVKQLLSRRENSTVEIRGFSPASGGCINHGGILNTSAGSFFLKWSYADRFPAMFHVEAKGLQLLAATHTVKIPEVVEVSQAGVFQFLLLEHILAAPRKRDYFEILGRQLAELHKTSNSRFGLDHQNFIGSLPQRNDWKNSWVEFFVSERLEAQVKIGVDKAVIPNTLTNQFATFFSLIPSLLSIEKPALIHGDLWSGNLINDQGDPCLIDPAVYFGHREVDLAMTQLFGGFDQPFYDAYLEEFPCEPGLQDRLDIYQLYPLLVHVNLFGSGYLQGIRSTLARYV